MPGYVAVRKEDLLEEALKINESSSFFFLIKSVQGY